MAMSTRKFFFASKYTFSDGAVEVLRSRLKDALQGPAPFVTYDRENHLFSFEIDRVDTRTEPTFLKCMRACIDEQQNLGAFDLPSIVPQSGTVIQNEFQIRASTRHEPEDALLNITEAEDSEARDSSSNISRPLVQYWPDMADGKDFVQIPLSILNAISTATGSHVTEERELKRWRFDGANATNAVHRLQNLASVMVSK